MTHFNKGPSYGLSAEVKNKEEGDEWHGIARISYCSFMDTKAEVEHGTGLLLCGGTAQTELPVLHQHGAQENEQ